MKLTKDEIKALFETTFRFFFYPQAYPTNELTIIFLRTPAN